MAEILLSFVAKSILGKVASLATGQISSTWGFKEELKELQDSLTMIQAKDESVELWLSKLKDVACDADNVIGEFAYEVLRQKVEIQMKNKYQRSLKKVVWYQEWT